MNFIDKKYINLISQQLKNFKWKNDNLANCSCPICGDSKKNKFKARFFFSNSKKGNFTKTHCHNCGYDHPFGVFLNGFDSTNYRLWKNENFIEKQLKQNNGVIFKKEVIPNIIFEENPLKYLSRCDLLNEYHQAIEYLNFRQIPKEKFKSIYYTENFRKWYNDNISKKFEKDDNSDPRLIFPYIAEDGEFFACSARSIVDSNQRYYNPNWDTEGKYPHIRGLNSLNKDQISFVVEGAIDSLFLNNSLSIGSFHVDLTKFDFSNSIFVLDNEPRNVDIVKMMNRYIENGYKTCIWPEIIKEKDINEMILSGKTSSEIEKIILENSFTGLEGKLKLANWRKI
jgi:hypothetical protein